MKPDSERWATISMPTFLQEMTQVTAPVVKQGFLEGSNVDMGREITEMLMTNRIYESSQRIVKMVDESLAKTVNDLGRF